MLGAPILQEVPAEIGTWVFQGIVATLFAVFAWQLARLNKDEREKQNAAWQEWMAGQQKAISESNVNQQTALSKSTDIQTAMLAAAIDREREQRREVMSQAYGQFSENMDRIAAGLGELTKAIAIHDDNAQGRHEKIMSAVLTINGKKSPRRRSP